MAIFGPDASIGGNYSILVAGSIMRVPRDHGHDAQGSECSSPETWSYVFRRSGFAWVAEGKSASPTRCSTRSEVEDMFRCISYSMRLFSMHHHPNAGGDASKTALSTPRYLAFYSPPRVHDLTVAPFAVLTVAPFAVLTVAPCSPRRPPFAVLAVALFAVLTAAVPGPPSRNA